MLFPAGVNIASFNVTILDDRIAECPEEFFLDLKIPPAAQLMGVARVKPYTATVNITDEDGDCSSMHCVVLHTVKTVCSTYL